MSLCALLQPAIGHLQHRTYSICHLDNHHRGRLPLAGVRSGTGDRCPAGLPGNHIYKLILVSIETPNASRGNEGKGMGRRYFLTQWTRRSEKVSWLTMQWGPGPCPDQKRKQFFSINLLKAKGPNGHLRRSKMHDMQWCQAYNKHT